MSHVHRESADPRRGGKCACGTRLTPADRHAHPTLVPAPPVAPAPAETEKHEEYVERDIALERYLTDMAARAAGYFQADADGRPVGNTLGLDDFADARAWSGGVRATIDAVREAQEELADARHYLVWGVQQVERAYRLGDPDAAEMAGRYMRALSHLIQAWHALAGSTRGPS